MAVIIGSARIDENGNITGGQAGDQTCVEVCTEKWFLHKQGWRVFRCKDANKAEKIAWDMQAACDNRYIGYDQGQNQTLYQVAAKVGFNCAKVTTPCETDCARLVRVCVLYAGIAIVDFYTATEADALLATGEFEELTDKKYTESEDFLKRGDILVTKTRGHSVVVLSDGKNANDVAAPKEYDNTLSGTWKVFDGNKLNMRNGAGTDYEIIETLQPNTKVVCYGYFTTVDGRKWLYVQHDGLVGFCSTKYLEKVTDGVDQVIEPAERYDKSLAGIWAVLHGNSLNMRRGAGTGYKVIETLHSDDQVQCYGYYSMVKNTKWLYVKHGDKIGYCSTKYLRKV